MTASSNIVTIRVVIEGRVQRVGFRYWVIDQAKSRHLNGWVRNLRSGEVEALFSGTQVTVEDMIEACHQGPAHAQVKSVQQFSAEAPDKEDFLYLPTI